MSNSKPVMSHDPLAGLDDEAAGEVVRVPQQALDAAQESAVQAPAGDAALVLEASLTIADVGDYHAILAPYIEAGGSVTLDGSQVEAVDGAGLQLLSAFIKDLIQKSLGVSWVGASETLLRAARQFGVVNALQLDQLDQAA